MPELSREDIYNKLSTIDEGLRLPTWRAIICLPDWLYKTGRPTAARLVYVWLHEKESSDYGSKDSKEGLVPGIPFPIKIDNVIRKFRRYKIKIDHFSTGSGTPFQFKRLISSANLRMKLLNPNETFPPIPLDPPTVSYDLDRIFDLRNLRESILGKSTPGAKQKTLKKLSEGDSGSFIPFKDSSHYIGAVSISGKESLVIDIVSNRQLQASDLTASLGSFGIRMYVRGKIALVKKQYEFQATHRGFRIFDFFDFTGDQYLGSWTQSGESLIVPRFQKGDIRLNNEVFRDFAKLKDRFNNALVELGRREGRPKKFPAFACQDLVVFSNMDVANIEPSWKYVLPN